MPRVDPQHIRTAADELAAAQGCYVDLRDVEKVQRFAEQFCTLQDGDHAGEPLTFLPWVVRDIITPLYGWKRPDSTRRFRRGSCWCPRKVAKTTSLAVLSLFQIFEEPAAQVYCVSSAIDTAGHLFRTAADMVESSPALSKHLWVRRNIKTIEYPAAKSFFKVLSGSKVAKSGHNTSCCFWDEISEIQDDEAWQRLYLSGKSRRQPIWFSISTPQYNRYSLAWDQYKKAAAIRDGKDTDVVYLSVIHGVPDSVDWKDPQNWWPHLEPLGKEVVNRDYYLGEWNRAKDNPRDLARFRNHCLCQWTESLEGWLPQDKIDRCFRDIDETDLHGKRCFIGVDGAVSHLAAYVLFFPDTMTVIPRFFHPHDTAKKSDDKYGTKYEAWAPDFVTLTSGDLFDWQTVKQSLKADIKRFDVAEVAFDPYSLEGRLTELQSELDCPVTAVPPSKAHVAEPTKRLEMLVLSEQLKCQNNPCLKWNFQNAAVKGDAHDRITLDRDKASGRYDGVAALTLALARWMADDDGDTVYNDRGIITL